MTNIVSMIFEARIHSLIRKRDKALIDGDYELVGKLNWKISNSVSRRIKWC